MNCENCKAIIDKGAKFCPYCGKENQGTSNDPFANIRVDFNNETTTNQVSEPVPNKIQYKNELPNRNKISSDKKDYKSLIGLILGVVSIPISIINVYLGIPVAIMALILVILGYKKTTRGIAITSLVITVISFVTTIITTVFVIVGSIMLTFSNGQEITIKDYLVGAFYNGYYSNYVHGQWVNEHDEQLSINPDGTYYIYTDKTTKDDNYYKGMFNFETGINIGYDETIFTDNDYYYYQFNTYSNSSKIDGVIYDQTIELLEDGFTIKLSKDRKKLVLEEISTDSEIKFTRK